MAVAIAHPLAPTRFPLLFSVSAFPPSPIWENQIPAAQ